MLHCPFHTFALPPTTLDLVQVQTIEDPELDFTRLPDSCQAIGILYKIMTR